MLSEPPGSGHVLATVNPSSPPGAPTARLLRLRSVTIAVTGGLWSLLGPVIGPHAAAQQLAWMLGPFAKPRSSPVLSPRAAVEFLSPLADRLIRWEANATFNPAALARADTIYLFYRAEDATGEPKIGGHTSRIGLATSEDGLTFTPEPRPVLYPDRDAQTRFEWPGGVEDPRVVETTDSTYVLTYTQWNRDLPRLAVATSRDLRHWTKHGPAFAKLGGGKYLNVASKSGAILVRPEGDRLVAAKVAGTYWMYCNVPELWIATSDNLIDWMPLEAGDGGPLVVLTPRPGYFDSWLVEAGPPAILTPRGIVVVYNAGNSGRYGAPGLAPRVYTAGQALFDADQPFKLLARSDAPFLEPTASYERTGQYTAGTTFAEGLVPFRGRWYLYYGTADSRVGVAVWDPQRPQPRERGRPR